MPSPVIILKTSGGSGQLISRLTNDEIDVAMYDQSTTSPESQIYQALLQCSYRSIDFRDRQRIEGL